MKKITLTIYTIILIAFFTKFTINHSQLTSNDILNENKNKYDVYINLEKNELNLFNMNVLIKTYKIGSGKHSTPSPIGTWKIISKSKWGSGFGGSWMEINVPWGIYGIHGTKYPWSIGINASHGCIRMYNDDAGELYKILPIGTIVQISNGEYDPFHKNQRVIKPGNRGSDVLAIQQKLKNLGFYNGRLDGIYGDNLKNSLFKYQKSKGYKPHNNIAKWDLRIMGFEQFK